jgi:phosphatidate cytidylyltransferase
MPVSETQATIASSGSLGRRIASAAVLAPLALASVHAGGPLFAATVAFAAVLMTFEWARMVEGRALGPSFLALSIAASCACAAAAAELFPFAFATVLLGSAAAAAFARKRKPQWAAFGGLYIIAPSVALIWLRGDSDDGRSLALLLFLIVWAADSAGYFAGRLVGGPKMSPAISPAKTWAGAIGGLLVGAVAGYAAASILWGFPAAPAFVFFGASLGLASILGDMAESAFKRHFGYKDSSNFIPGHGGVLDRLDGMIFATSAMALVLYLHGLFGRVAGSGL